MELKELLSLHLVGISYPWISHNSSFYSLTGFELHTDWYTTSCYDSIGPLQNTGCPGSHYITVWMLPFSFNIGSRDVIHKKRTKFSILRVDGRESFTSFANAHILRQNLYCFQIYIYILLFYMIIWFLPTRCLLWLTLWLKYFFLPWNYSQLNLLRPD